MASERFSDDKVDVSALAKPLHFHFANRDASNRFLKAAMTERLSSWSPQDLPKRGVPTKELINAYKRWGEGNIGLILTGNIMIDYDQLEAAGNAIIPPKAEFSGERFERFKELATQAKKNGSLVVGQVSHPGRQTEARLQPNPVSASDLQLKGKVMGMEFAQPHAASEQEIKDIIVAFTHAAEYLYKAGYDGIELHGAHGYLLAQFLSQSTNKRTDQYGGSLMNRARLIREVAQSVREKVPASTGFILGIKINSVEFQNDGFDAEDCRHLCRSLEEDAHFDFVELSGGTYESMNQTFNRKSTENREAFFLEFAEVVVPALRQTKCYITGGLRTAQGMVKALESVDGVGLARPLCQEPSLCGDILSGRVHAALKPRIDQQDFGLTNVAAGTQIRQLARDQQPINLSRQDNVEIFQKDMQIWADKMAKDFDRMREYGYVDIVSQETSPYGSLAVAA